MKKTMAGLIALIILAGALSAGVVKGTKSQITFKGFGTFTTSTNDKVTADRKLTEMNNSFKGKGLLGGLAAKTILRSGQFVQIFDLPALTLYQVDHKKKEYSATPIEKIKEDKDAEKGTPEETTPEKSQVKITKSEFKVEDTGESKTINQFNCKKYLVHWLVEWENTQTGEKGANNLESIVWTTPFSGDIKAAQDEEMAFSREYMKKIGMDSDKFQQDVLGTEWLALLGSMNPADGGKSSLSPNASQVAKEMKKLQGYPVVIDGKYFVAGTAKPEAAKEEESGGGGISGALGKFASKALKKKPNPEEEKAPVLAFYTEVTGLSVSGIDDAAFQVPAGYKKKG